MPDDGVDVHGPPASGPVARPVRRRVVAGLVAVGLVAAAAGVWWSRSLRAYEQVGYAVSGALPGPGASLLVGIGGRPAEGAVTLVEVVPVVTANTAGATLEVVVCDRPDQGLPPGVVAATAVQHCGRVAPVDGYVHRAVEGGEAGPTARDRDGHLVLQITPQRAGTVAVSGVRVTYRDGLRRQTQFLASGLRFTSP